MNFDDASLIGWLGVLATAAGGLITYVAVPRRTISVGFEEARLIAAPRNEEGIAVTVHDKAMDQPIYHVQLDLRAAGNRDVSMHSATEYAQVTADEGIEFATVRYQAFGMAKIEVVENTNRHLKIRFDLLKKGETIRVNMFVKSERVFTKATLARRFPTAIQIKDVRKVTLATNRIEIYAGLFAVFVLGTIFAGLNLSRQFVPVDSERLLLAADGAPVVMKEVDGANLRVCRVTKDLWEQAECSPRTVAEVAGFKPLPSAGAPLYANTDPLWARLLAGLSVFVWLSLMAFGDQIGGVISNILEAFRRKD